MAESGDIETGVDVDGSPPAVADAGRLQQEAVAWLSLLSSGTATQADGEALRRWCNEVPAHAEAFARVARVWQMLAPVAAEAERPRLGAITRALPQPSTLGRRAFLGGALAASAAGVAILSVHPPLGLWPSLAELRADFRTVTGEQRRIEIADGIAIDLNTRSSLILGKAIDNARQIEIVNGEAIIAARKGSGIPCVVVARSGRILAQDAKFDVRCDDGEKVRVVCLDGLVHVENEGQTVDLTVGQQVLYNRRGIDRAETSDPLAVAAWQQGRLIFRKEALFRVIAEVNRYRPGRIILLDNQLGARLIDASFQLDRLENLIVYLQQAFGVRVRNLPGAVVLIG